MNLLIILAVAAVFLLFVVTKCVVKKFKRCLVKINSKYNDCCCEIKKNLDCCCRKNICDENCACECSNKPFNIDGSLNADKTSFNCDCTGVCRKFRKLFEKSICKNNFFGECENHCKSDSKNKMDCEELLCQQQFVDEMADPETGFFYTGFSYDPCSDVFFSTKNAFQRKFGYCRFYDAASAISGMVIDSEPIKFKYKGRKWLLQFWKGQYGMTTGAEIGFYVSPGFKLRSLFTGRWYDSVTDCEMLDMEFILCKNGKKIMHRKGHSWWLTGFKLGMHSFARDLTMQVSVKFKESGMLCAFVKALKKKGYKQNQFCVDGNTVFIEYTRPKTHQPITKKLFGWWSNWYTKKYCQIYTLLTHETGGNTLKKIACLKILHPKLVKKVLNMGIYSIYGFGQLLNYLPNSGTFCKCFCKELCEDKRCCLKCCLPTRPECPEPPKHCCFPAQPECHESSKCLPNNITQIIDVTCSNCDCDRDCDNDNHKF